MDKVKKKRYIVLEYGLGLNFVDHKKCKIIEGLSNKYVRIGCKENSIMPLQTTFHRVSIELHYGHKNC
jgi:hypothetical protein